MEILAQAAEQAVQGSGDYLGYAIGAALLALVGGGGGGAWAMKRWSSGGAPGGSAGTSGAAAAGVCPVHDGLVKLLDERKLTSDAEFSEVRDELKDMRKETRDGFTTLFAKVDALSISIATQRDRRQ